MPRYIISLGSNISSGAAEVTKAINRLAEISVMTAVTPTYTTSDIRDAAKPQYTNAIAVIERDIEPEELNRLLKDYELSRGRKKGATEVIIDLDLVCRDNEILRPQDYCAPYFVEGLYLLHSVESNPEREK